MKLFHAPRSRSTRVLWLCEELGIEMEVVPASLTNPTAEFLALNPSNTVPVFVDGDTVMTDFSGREMSEKDFAFKEHRVRATPVFIFFGLDGKPMLRFTGVTADTEEFLWLGEFVVSGTHKSGNFTAYKRARLAGKK